MKALFFWPLLYVDFCLALIGSKHSAQILKFSAREGKK
jgi:hypothetical protein